MADAKSSNLKVRVISALLLLPVVLGALWYGGMVFRGFIAIVGLLMMWEWLGLVKTDPLLKLIFTAFAVGALLASFWLQTPDDFVRAFTGIIAAFLACMTLGLVFRQKQYSWIGLGVLVIGLSVLALMFINTDEQGDGQFQAFWLLISVWATDIGAYFAGRAFGGPKLAPKISPKKTWTGLGGGILAAGFTGILLFLAKGLYPFMDLGAYILIFLFGLGVAMLAQAGDLFESWVKRYFDVKDSGHLIPGHGGILDRVDGLLFTAPAFVILNLI